MKNIVLIFKKITMSPNCIRNLAEIVEGIDSVGNYLEQILIYGNFATFCAMLPLIYITIVVPLAMVLACIYEEIHKI